MTITAGLAVIREKAIQIATSVPTTEMAAMI